MLDERWSQDVEEIGAALQRILAAESTSERIRAAEARDDGRDPALEQVLGEFGLDALEGEPAIFARVALELGSALATTSHVETMPVLALLGRPGVALAFAGPVPAAVQEVAVLRPDGVYIERAAGEARRSAAGDLLVVHSGAGEGERVGEPVVAERLRRFALMVNAARLIGAARALLGIGAAYAKEREQFGKIIGSYQGISHRLARAVGEVDAAELLLRKAAFMADPSNTGDGAPSDAFAAMVYAKACDAGRFVATNVHQVFGGNGFAMEYDVQLYSRRLRNWSMRGPRPQSLLASLGRLVLDPDRRDALPLLWHYDRGMPLPRWAREADARPAGAA